MSYIRTGNKAQDKLVVVCNFTPVVRTEYKIGLPMKGKLKEIFNSDATDFGGSGVSNPKAILIEETPWNGRDFSAEITLPPLGVTVFKIGK